MNEYIDIKIELIENMNKNKVTIYTNPCNEKYIETILEMAEEYLDRLNRGDIKR